MTDIVLSLLQKWLSSGELFVLLIIIIILRWGPGILKEWKETLPLLINLEERQRLARRKRFADHVESEIRRLNNLEAWSDYRFAELEAEVEAEGRKRIRNFLPFLQVSRSGLRREKSLSKALETSQERLILVEGEPGSGKSVALRHVAQSMARRAMKARSSKDIIPIYINLKELKPQADKVTDKNLIQEFVLKSLNRANDRDIEEFLENEFDKGLSEGTWLFLFDSFDEIPDVLSSTEADAIIRKYSDAISDFLHGMNLCRGIVASRQFRGPGQSGWPRFRILQLSEARRAELVRKADLGTELQTTIVGQLGIASDEIRGMASNPMFLGLLCEYMRAGNPFPRNAHSVFETYVDTRLNRDQERLQRRFKLKPSEIRSTAENVAFCMAADPGLGLTPTRENIIGALKALDFNVPENLVLHLDALEYTKLARSEIATATGDSNPFTFSHRRFQEYFATCIVLREQKRVAPRLLLTDARWRETAVVICQTQPANLLQPLIIEARKILIEMKKLVPELIDNPLEYVNESPATTTQEYKLSAPFPWPPSILYLAGLLQDGFVNHLKDLPDDIRLEIGRILLTADASGTLSDRKWVMEVAGIIPSISLLWILRDAFNSESQWLSEVAFRQTARLSQIPNDVAWSIRQTLLRLYATGRLQRERYATYAHLSRLDNSASFIASLHLLSWATAIDLGDHIIISSLLTMIIINTQDISFGNVLSNFIWVLIFGLLSHRSLRALALSYVDGFTPGLKSNRASGYLSLFIASLMAFLRIFILPFVVAVILVDTSLPLPLIVLLLLLFFWAPFGLAAALTGQFTHPLWWILMPLWPIMYTVRNVKGILSAIWIQLRKHWKAIILLAVFFSLWSSSYWDYLGKNIFFSTLFQIVSFVFLILGDMLSTMFAAISLFWLIDDELRWIKWMKVKRNLLIPQDFLVLVGQFHYSNFRNKFTSNVRERGLVVAEYDADVLIGRLAIAVEHAMSNRKKRLDETLKQPFLLRIPSLLSQQIARYLTRKMRLEVDHESAPEEFFDAWLFAYKNNNEDRLAGWGIEFLDEIWKLSEQVHANQRDNKSV